MCLHLGALDCQSRKRLWEAFLPELDGDEDSGREVPRPPDLPARKRRLLGGGVRLGEGRPRPTGLAMVGPPGSSVVDREPTPGWTQREGSVVKGTGPQCLGADTGLEAGCPGGLEQEGVGMEYPQSS